MNAIFTTIFLLSSVILCICAPESFLPSLLSGGMNAAKCALTLFCIYAVWMGLCAVAEESRLTHKLSHLLSPVCRRVFKTDDGEAIKNISMNISCNLLGIGGAATPFGVKAIKALEKGGNTFAQHLLFIINATSIQLIPTTVIALRAANGSAAAHDITLPSLIATLISTGSAVFMYAMVSLILKKGKAGKGRRCGT